MNVKKNIPQFEEGRGYNRADWDDVSDNPEITEEQFKEFRPFKEVFPELAETIAGKAGAPETNPPSA